MKLGDTGEREYETKIDAGEKEFENKIDKEERENQTEKMGTGERE